MRTILPLVLLSLLLSSCDDNARGLAISDDGSVLLNTPEHQRTKVALHIQAGLTEQLGAHWRCHVTIAELPTYDDDENRGTSDHWVWDKATVAVDLVSDGGADLPQTIDSLHDAVWDYLHHRVDRPKHNLTIQITHVVDAARFAAMAPPPAGSAPVAYTANPAAPAPGGRHYTIQAKDTLADISTAFYGTPDRWRLIASANPGLNAAQLTPGIVIVIPPAP